MPALTLSDIRTLAPRADPRWAAALVELWPRLVQRGGLSTPARARHFLAQTAAESGGFSRFEEDLDYTAHRLTEVWPRRFPTLADARPFSHAPAKLAESVYGGRRDLGNREPGDGWRFHGRGPIQATGRAWYGRLSGELGLDLLADPGRLAEPRIGWESAAAIWSLSGLNAFADRDDIVGGTRRLNGGLTNLAERRRYLALAARLTLPPVDPARAPSQPAPVARADRLRAFLLRLVPFRRA